ncbi:flagellar filament capping protein FliD [Cedecea colo]|uniref:Flagellar hook-associated protein 2 n=1 Tax=Cedecea colo TaxID=2552946 RepID=A0ABX0VP02_9ENTR|nr:flagellar filament capping protein FliD [Cedecea colo]NIY48677.1 flagellar cap protein [Cedecea colo]
MASISSLGIGSGLDTTVMLAQIKAGEQTRLSPYTALQSSYKAKVSAWGQVSSGLSTLQGTVKKLTGDAFNTLTVSTNKAFTATASSTARADTHSVTVLNLATSHKLKTDNSFDNQHRQLGSATEGEERTVTIAQQDGSKMQVTLRDDETSLSQIAKAVNAAKGDVAATVQRTDDGYQLVLSSRTTGTDGKMTVSVEGDAVLDAVLNSANLHEVSAAEDAKLIVDGSEYTRSSNSVTDILDGITLTLTAPSEDNKSEQLTLTQNTSAIKSTLQDFVKQYNGLLTSTTSLSKYVPYDSSHLADADVATQNAQNGALMGDSTLRGLVSEIRSAVNAVYGESEADYASLADLGIKIDASTGQMTLDEKKIDEAIADSPNGIATMFTGSGDRAGLADALGAIITLYIGDTDKKTDGIIKTSTEGLTAQADRMQEQIDKTQRLIDASVERYRVQFQNLDTTMSKLNSMNSQLSGILATL